MSLGHCGDWDGRLVESGGSDFRGFFGVGPSVDAALIIPCLMLAVSCCTFVTSLTSFSEALDGVDAHSRPGWPVWVAV